MTIVRPVLEATGSLASVHRSGEGVQLHLDVQGPARGPDLLLTIRGLHPGLLPRLLTGAPARFVVYEEVADDAPPAPAPSDAPPAIAPLIVTPAGGHLAENPAPDLSEESADPLGSEALDGPASPTPGAE